mmetsp:Transcript_14629/g.31349  ORF Transcript_14629/g.31349 Transcript_14629/m.31349 type:complete len:245 (-) Transcript_14629:767-1501(-)
MRLARLFFLGAVLMVNTFAADDFYAVLGVSRDADGAALKRAFRKVALKHHPDKQQGSDEEKEDAQRQFILASRAFEVLSDPEKRRIYDIYGEKGLESTTSTGGGHGAGAGRAACSAAFRRWYILMKASLMLTCWMHRRVETCPGWFSTMHRGVGMQKRWHPWWSSLRRSSKVSSKLRRWMSEIWQFRQGCVSRCRRRCGSTLPRGLSRVRSGVPGRRCALWRLSHCEECLCTAALSTERRRLRR